MLRRGSIVKEVRGSFIGGTMIRIFIAGADEAAHSSGKDEEILGETNSTTTYHCTLG
jgi:hypothetical protein